MGHSLHLPSFVALKTITQPFGHCSLEGDEADGEEMEVLGP